MRTHRVSCARTNEPLCLVSLDAGQNDEEPRQAALLTWQSARPFRFVRHGLTHGALHGQQREELQRRLAHAGAEVHRGP
jgi:hypothetical protein